MERLPSGLREDEGETPPASPRPRGGLFSCWACLKRAFPPWRRLLRRSGSCRTPRRPKPGNFRYDPLSYSQNFEDKDAWDRDDADDPSAYNRGFSSRFVVITPAAPPNPNHPGAGGDDHQVATGG